LSRLAAKREAGAHLEAARLLTAGARRNFRRRGLRGAGEQEDEGEGGGFMVALLADGLPRSLGAGSVSKRWPCVSARMLGVTGG